MRKLIFSMLAMAAWKWFTTPSQKPASQPARRNARALQPRSAAAARSHGDVKRSASVKRAAPKRKKAAPKSDTTSA